MVLYENNLICIFMNSNTNLKNEGKFQYQNTHISAVTHPDTWYQMNPVPLYFYLMVGYANYLIFIFMNINEHNRNERKTYKNKGCA